MALHACQGDHLEQRLDGLADRLRRIEETVIRIDERSEGPAVGVDDGGAAAVLLALLGRVVVRLAQRDEVVGVEEQARVAAVRLGVVDNCRGRRAAHCPAIPAVRLAAELAGAQ
jgi:hypothetical protein